jgi:hypothetical protein
MNEQEIISETGGEKLKPSIKVQVSEKEYLDQPEEKKEEWLKGQLQKKLPSGFLKEAFLHGFEHCTFRCIKRKSNNDAVDPQVPTSTYTEAIKSIQKTGIDAENRHTATYIEPGRAWMRFFMLSEKELQQQIDTSIVLIYHHRPYVNEYKKDPTKATLHIPNTLHGNLIPKEDAAQYPTLKDNLIGYIEVQWNKEDKAYEKGRLHSVFKILKKVRQKLAHA